MEGASRVARRGMWVAVLDVVVLPMHFKRMLRVCRTTVAGYRQVGGNMFHRADKEDVSEIVCGGGTRTEGPVSVF